MLAPDLSSAPSNTPQAETQASAEHVEYVLRLADSSLILAQRLSEWCGHAPVLEEDLALANIALDYLGQARLLLTHAGNLEGRGRDEDQLAFLRSPGEFRNYTLVELPNCEPASGGAAQRDFAFTLVRNFFFSTWQCELWQALLSSRDPQLAAIAEKSLKEARYHCAHASDWMLRLGDGTEESHRRVQYALDRLFPYTAELFTPDAIEAAVAAAGIGASGTSLEPGWRSHVAAVVESATLVLPAHSAFRSQGKFGVHSEHLGHLLAEMQYLQRAYPGLEW